MDKWAELRTAYQVAKLGTVSAAAKAMGVHRATVNRHIDILEAELGARIFMRHAKGYTLTDLGKEVLHAARTTEQIIDDLVGRSRGLSGQVTGEIIVTAVSGLASLIMPAIADYTARHPQSTVIFLSTDELAKLEYGEAHVALRAGQKPTESDYVVQPFPVVRFGLYAHQAYVARHGPIGGPEDFPQHWFVAGRDTETRVPFTRWLSQNIPGDRVVLRVSNPQTTLQAVMAGVGIGFLPEHEAREREGLHEILPPSEEWTAPLWLVTHVDLHRTEKVQTFLSIIKQSVGRHNAS